MPYTIHISNKEGRLIDGMQVESLIEAIQNVAQINGLDFLDLHLTTNKSYRAYRLFHGDTLLAEVILSNS